MKPLGWFSERGGTTFAGEGGRQTETWKARNEIDLGLDEYLDCIEAIDCESGEFCECCQKEKKVLVRIK
jgi:hypothetical protein